MGRKLATTRVNQRSRDEIKDILREALRREFPHDTVDITDGYKGNIHVLVVSRKFDRMRTGAKKQDMLWTIIDSTGLTDEEKQKISMTVPMSPAEIV